MEDFKKPLHSEPQDSSDSYLEDIERRDPFFLYHLSIKFIFSFRQTKCEAFFWDNKFKIR